MGELDRRFFDGAALVAARRLLRPQRLTELLVARHDLVGGAFEGMQPVGVRALVGAPAGDDRAERRPVGAQQRGGGAEVGVPAVFEGGERVRHRAPPGADRSTHLIRDPGADQEQHRAGDAQPLSRRGRVDHRCRGAHDDANDADPKTGRTQLSDVHVKRSLRLSARGGYFSSYRLTRMRI